MTRLLRLELRRNTLLPLAPLVAVMFWFSLYRPGLSGLAVWSLRSLTLQNALQGLGPFVAGVAAWVAARDGRRNAGDLVATTARPAWARAVSRWTATAGWALLFYTLATAAQVTVTARQATWGAPIWWPAAVGATGVLAFAAVGTLLGTWLPGRFVAPLVAIGSFLALAAGEVALSRHNPYGRITPIASSIGEGSGVFYPVLPDLPVTQLMFLTGLGLTALAVLGLPAGATGPRARRAALALTLAGAALAGTGIGLAGTSRPQPPGVVVPALHDPADDTPLAYQPDCSPAPVPVCVHPAYRKLLPDLTTALTPILDQVTAVPGGPARVVQATEAKPQAAALDGDPPLLSIVLFNDANRAEFTHIVRHEAALGITGPGTNPTQRAIAIGLTLVAGEPAPTDQPAQILAAAQRYAALPADTRRAWLATHLADLRAGHLTLTDLP